MTARPTARPTDVTEAGSHYLKEWVSCPRKAAYQHLYPHPQLDTVEDATFGIVPFWKDPNLLTGSALHAGLEAWYHSRIRDGADTGEASLDHAIEGARTYWALHRGELQSQDEVPEQLALCEKVLRLYHDYYGPGGPLDEWRNKDIEVAVDDEGAPFIEREFAVQLSPRRKYTARIDLVAWHHGRLTTVDHKSTKANRLRIMFQTAELDAQFTGHIWLLREAAPEMPLNCAMVNALVKDRSPKSGPPFSRELTSRTDEQLRMYSYHCHDVFSRIEEWKDTFNRLLEAGADPDEAFNVAFPQDGMRNGHCMAYYRKCEYWDLCASAGASRRRVETTYKPRTIVKEQHTR